jgi:hypothetical protein
MKNSWFFPESTGGEFDGFNDAGIEFFAGSPYSYIAREVIQNSFDTAKPLDGRASVPVKVAFYLVEIKKSDFPDLKGLKKAIAGALKQAFDHSRNPPILKSSSSPRDKVRVTTSMAFSRSEVRIGRLAEIAIRLCLEAGPPCIT